MVYGMKKVFCLFLSIVILSALLSGCAIRENDPYRPGEEQDQTTVPNPAEHSTEADVEETTETAPGQSSGEEREGDLTFVIETPYCNFKYPKKWEDAVEISASKTEEVYTVQFSADGNPLFAISCNDGSGYVLGTLKAAGKSVSISLTTYQLDANSAQYATYSSMQEDVNVILEHLRTDYAFDLNGGAEEDETSVFEIQTAVAPLYYPEKWKGSVTVQVTEKSVEFLCEDAKLFSVLFGPGDAYLLGTYRGTEIRIASYDLEAGAFSKAEYQRLCAMQEDVNVMIEYLMEDSNFTLSP